MAELQLCPECGINVTQWDANQIVHHFHYHWNKDTPQQHWTEEALRRIDVLLDYRNLKRIHVGMKV